jgi:probable rRNA maturation factor
VSVENAQKALPCEIKKLKNLLRLTLSTGVNEAEVSLALVEDRKMQELNKQFLGRETTTDVLAFTYEKGDNYLQGEIIVNAQVAAREAEQTEHSAQEELLLYVVHGGLHLLGYEDYEPEDRQQMHRRALELLNEAGIEMDPRTLLED